MNKVLVTFILFGLLLVVGCHAPCSHCPNSENLTHKDTLIVVTNIAVERLKVERQMLLQECTRNRTPVADCEAALKCDEWIELLIRIEDYVKSEEGQELNLRAIYLQYLVSGIVDGMEGVVSSHTKPYVEHVGVAIDWMLHDDDSRISWEAVKKVRERELR